MGFRELLEKHRLKNKLKKINNKKYNIFVVYHKPSKVYESDIITPIHAGRSIALNPIQEGCISQKDCKKMQSQMIGDDSGINISDRNRYYNEMSVAYWIWKNIKSPYVGLFHYRRFFDLSFENPDAVKGKDDLNYYSINRKTVEKLLSEYDLLLPRKLGFSNSIYDNYVQFLRGDDMDFVLDYIKERYPEINEFAQNLKHTNICYMFNMFITSREIFEGYAEFMFDVLFALDRHITDRDKRSIYQQRAEGFVAERLTSIYFDYLIATTNLKVKEFPVIRLDNRPKKTTLSFTRFAVKNDKGKGITMFFRIKF